MGIYDRDYYREDPPRWGGVAATRGTIGLIGASVGLFFMQVLTTRPIGPKGQPISEFRLWTEFHFDKIVHGEVWRVFSSGLIPDTFLFSLILSMLMLFWAGKELERTYGTWPFVAFYLLASLAATLGKLIAGFAGMTEEPSVGIGGAIFATMVLFACLNPRRPILVFFILPVPIGLLVGILLAIAVLATLQGGTNLNAIGIISGAAFGFLFFKFAPGVMARLSATKSRTSRRPSIRLHVSPPVDEERERSAPLPLDDRPTPTAMPRHSAVAVDEQLEAKLDRVLSKVGQYGKASLTAEEVEILQKASEIYKKKRS